MGIIADRIQHAESLPLAEVLKIPANYGDIKLGLGRILLLQETRE